MGHVGEESAFSRIGASCPVQSPLKQPSLLQFPAHLILDAGYTDESLRAILCLNHPHTEILRSSACDRPEYETAEAVALKPAPEAVKAYGSDEEIIVIGINAAVRNLKHSQ